ncbi:AimR family lysis-lysogeny pheromone receptor [Bacillus horti]|uniref:Plasmid maintenance system antidote protein VapI n=1 Tax=Caldalkalibacillus horti TaxID=77523 RepID=A0ABT9VZC4_9BACI|nr:AimR family lysis-lysogeny pheromone receptor [Bacillus horti]MDQ0166172.1 plasmid maintenance system antidote protein VapI [Bacillus horti]
MLQERILQTLEDLDDIDQRKLARVANTTEAALSRFLNEQEELIFESVLRIVKYLYPNEQVTIMADYIITQKSYNARLGLEYCSINRLWVECNYLLNMLSKSTDPCDQEWVFMYTLLKEKREATHSHVHLISKVEQFHPKEIELKVLASIFRRILYFELNDNNTVLSSNNDAETLIEKIKSDYIRSSYSVRLGVIMSSVHLYGNNPEKARQYSYYIIGQDFIDFVKSVAYNNLGQTYMLEDYERAKDYFITAINYAITFNHSVYLKTARLNLSFLQSYYQIDSGFSEPIDDYATYANYIFYLIQKGEHSLAQKNMDQIDIKTLTDWDKAFYFYYMGLLKNDRSSLYESVKAFYSVENYFYLQFPLLELQKLGDDEEALQFLKKRGRFSEKIVNRRIR